MESLRNQHRFNIIWVSTIGVIFGNPLIFFLGMYLLTEYVCPEGVL
jgi:hypothetical protein